MIPETKQPSDWTTASVRRARLKPIRKEALRRKNNGLENASERLVLDEVIRLGAEAIQSSRA